MTMEIPSLESVGARVIAYIVGAVIVLFVVWAAIHFYTKSRSQAAQSRVEASQAQAASNSASDAVNTVAASGESERASEDLTRSNEKDIRNADGANAPVNPAARDAGLRALCLRGAYRDDPKCRVFKSHP
jgi:biopolymer transport protein ExbB/TolQ